MKNFSNVKFFTKIKNIFSEFQKHDTIICAVTAIVIISFVIAAYTSDKGRLKPTFGENGNISATPNLNAVDADYTDLEKRLSQILMKIDGVGNVSVMVTFPNDILDADASDNIKSKQNITDAVGAIIIADGAGNPEVRIKIQLAVQTALRLEAHQIKIFEMGQ